MMPPSTGISVISATSAALLTEVSSSSRSTARPRPSSRPSTTARPMLRSGCGETGVSGRAAGSTTVALIGAWVLPGGVSRSLTKSLSCVDTDAAIAFARWGSGSVTVISRITVSGTTVAVTWCDRSSDSMSRCRSAIHAGGQLAPTG